MSCPVFLLDGRPTPHTEEALAGGRTRRRLYILLTSQGLQDRPDATERAPNFLTLAIWDLSGSLPAFFDLLSEGQILSSLQNPKGITAAQGCLHVYEMQLLCWQILCMGSGQVLTVPVLQMKRCSY